MPQPPIVPGLTQTAQSAGPGDLMSQLAGGPGGDAAPPNGATLLRQAIDAMQQAAQVDPRLAERIGKAIDTIEGRDPESVRDRQSGGGRSQNRIGPTTGTAKTPI